MRYAEKAASLMRRIRDSTNGLLMIISDGPESTVLGKFIRLHVARLMKYLMMKLKRTKSLDFKIFR